MNPLDVIPTDGAEVARLDNAHVFHSWSAQKLIDPNFKGKAVYGQKAIMALEGGTKFDGSFSGRAKHPQAVAAEQAGGAKAQYIVARANIDGFAPKES